MKVYLAGERDAVGDWLKGVKRRLFSYYYHGLKTNELTATIKESIKLKHDLFLDSGAFTAFTKGIEININRYAEYIKKTEGIWSVCSNLDTIGKR